MIDRRRQMTIDLTAVGLWLAGLAALVLGEHTPANATFWISLAAMGLVSGTWIWASAPPSTAATEAATRDRPPLWKRLALLVLLFAVAWLVYFDALRLHFWGGFDEFSCFQDPHFVRDWRAPPGGRPLLFSPLQLYRVLFFPNQIEGFLWLAFGLWFANSLLLKAILDRLFPDDRLIGVVAAVLLIAHRGDPLRYMVMWSALYYLRPLFWFLLALWLLLRSYEREQRWQLVAACVAASIGLLTTEGLFPLMLLGPVLLLRLKRDGPSYFTWTALWLGATTVLAVNFLVYLMQQGGDSYQARQVGGVFSQPGVLALNLLTKVVGFWETINGRFYLDYSWRWFAIAGLVAIVVRLSMDGEPRRRRLTLRCGAVALTAVVLAVLPFMHLSTSARTLLLAAPAHAALVTFIFLACLELWPQRLRQGVITATVAVVVAAGAVHSHRDQAKWKPIHFEKTARVFEQVHQLAPELAADSLVLFVLEQPDNTPLGPNYHVRKLAEAVLGAKAGQVPYNDLVGENVALTAAGVALNDGEGQVFGFDQVVAFELAFDGELTLLEELPQSLLPEGVGATGYAPRRRVVQSDRTLSPLLRRPSWLSPPHDEQSSTVAGTRKLWR